MKSFTPKTNDDNEQRTNENGGTDDSEEAKKLLIQEILSLQKVNDELQGIKNKMDHLINDP